MIKLILTICFILFSYLTIFAQAPSAPSNIVLTVHNTETIIVAWDCACTTETTFRVEMKIGVGGPYIEIAYTYANYQRQIVDFLSPNTTYFFRVRARNANGDSTYATEQSATTSVAVTPVAAISAPSTLFTLEVGLFDARGSTEYCKRPQADGTSSLTIDFGDGTSVKTPVHAAGHSYRNSGSYTITVTAKNCNGVSDTEQVGITVSDIPACTGINCRTFIEQGSASANKTHLDTLIAAAAAANNTAEQEINIPAGTIINGPITLPATAGTKYITIRTSTELAAKKRITPSDAASLVTILAMTGNSYPDNIAIRTPTTASTNPSKYYRLYGIRTKKNVATVDIAVLMTLGTDSGGGLNLLTELVHHFIIDHCWIDGDEDIDTSEINSGIRTYGDYISVHDSHIGPFRLIGLGVDTSAISVTAGRGPYSFWNNYMVAGSENFSVSGGPTEVNTATISSPTTTSAIFSATTNLSIDDNVALPVNNLYGALQSTIIRSINVGTGAVTYDPIPVIPDNGGTAKWGATPSFGELRNNYLFKPLEWRSTDPSYNGQDTQIKNLIEYKFGRYWWHEGNVYKNTWVKDQDYAIVLAPRNFNGGNSEVAVIRNLGFRNEIFWNAAKGMTLQAGDGTNYGACPPNCSPVQRMQDIVFSNNLFMNVGVSWDSSGAGHQFINFNGAAEQGNNTVFVQLKRMFFFHNTWDNGATDNSNGSFSDFGDAGVQSGCFGCVFLDNTSQGVGFGWRSNASLHANVNIPLFFPPGDSSNWDNNYVVNANGLNYPATAITQSLTWTSQVFTNYTNGNYILQTGVGGKNAATDGTDTGIDHAALVTTVGANSSNLKTATIKTVTGDFSGTKKCNWGNTITGRCNQ